jgi:hypothetical protein
MLENVHSYGPTDTSMTLIKSEKTGRYLYIVESYFIPILPINNMIINDKTRSKAIKFTQYMSAQSILFLSKDSLRIK